MIRVVEKEHLLLRGCLVTDFSQGVVGKEGGDGSPPGVRHTDLGEKVGMFMPPELSEGGFLRWEKITRSRTPSHTNWWANELPALLPLRPNLAAGRMWTEGPWIGRVQKLQSSWGCAGGRGNRRIKEGD